MHQLLSRHILTLLRTIQWRLLNHFSCSEHLFLSGTLSSPLTIISTPSLSLVISLSLSLSFVFSHKASFFTQRAQLIRPNARMRVQDVGSGKGKSADVNLTPRSIDVNLSDCRLTFQNRQLHFAWPLGADLTQQKKNFKKASLSTSKTKSVKFFFFFFFFFFFIPTTHISIVLMSTVFANDPGDRGSVPGRIIPKKWYLMPPCLTLSLIR